MWRPGHQDAAEASEAAMQREFIHTVKYFYTSLQLREKYCTFTQLHSSSNFSCFVDWAEYFKSEPPLPAEQYSDTNFTAYFSRCCIAAFTVIWGRPPSPCTRKESVCAASRQNYFPLSASLLFSGWSGFSISPWNKEQRVLAGSKFELSVHSSACQNVFHPKRWTPAVSLSEREKLQMWKLQYLCLEQICILIKRRPSHVGGSGKHPALWTVCQLHVKQHIRRGEEEDEERRRDCGAETSETKEGKQIVCLNASALLELQQRGGRAFAVQQLCSLHFSASVSAAVSLEARSGRGEVGGNFQIELLGVQGSAGDFIPPHKGAFRETEEQRWTKLRPSLIRLTVSRSRIPR